MEMVPVHTGQALLGLKLLALVSTVLELSNMDGTLSSLPQTSLGKAGLFALATEVPKLWIGKTLSLVSVAGCW